MKKSRKRYAQLGRILPATTVTETGRLWKVSGDSKQLHFKELWARQEELVSVTLSDVLDFAINRNFRRNEREYRFGIGPSGVYVRDAANHQNRVIPFADLLSLVEGQSLLPIAP